MTQKTTKISAIMNTAHNQVMQDKTVLI